MIETVGSAGITFFYDSGTTAANQTAAADDEPEMVDEEPVVPPAKYLQCSIHTNSSGTRHEDLGHPLGWPGIEQTMGLNLDITSATGFD